MKVNESDPRAGGWRWALWWVAWTVTLAVAWWAGEQWAGVTTKREWRGVEVPMTAHGELEYAAAEAIVRARAGDPWVELHLPRGSRPFDEVRIRVQLLAPWGAGARVYWVPAGGSIDGFSEAHAAAPEEIDVGNEHLELSVRVPPPGAVRLRLDPPDWAQVRVDRVWVQARPWSSGVWRWGPVGLVAVLGGVLIAWRIGSEGDGLGGRRREAWLAATVALAAVAGKLWLVGVQPLQAMGHFVHDDALFVTLAEHLRAGRWLGPYNEFTLIKGPMYPLWVAASGALGVPLLLGQHLAAVAAAALMVWALQPLVRRPWLLAALFLWLLFNPATFAAGEGTRVLRSNVAAALGLATWALWVGAVLRWRLPPGAIARWTAPAGLVGGAFWLTREEGVWLLPALAVPAAWVVWELWRARRIGRGNGANDRGSMRERGWRLAVLFLVPLAGWSAAIGAVCALNWRHYGWWGVVEMREPGFKAAYGALLRSGLESRHPMIPLTRAERERLHEVSPAFGELRPMFDGEIGEFWALVSAGETGFAPQDREHSAVTLLWALRAAAAAAGYHQSAPQAAAFYRRIADEVNGAIEEGTVPGAKRRHLSLAPRLRGVWVTLLPSRIVEAGWYLVRFDGWTARSGPSWGTWESIERFRRLTHERLGEAPGPEERMMPAPPLRAREFRLQTLERIHGVYRAAVPVAWVLALVMLVAAAGVDFRQRRCGAALAIAVAATGGVAALILLVSLVDATAFPAITLSYLAPAYPLALLVPALAALAWGDARAAGGAVKPWWTDAPLAVALLLAGTKLALVAAQPLQATGHAPHDDTLFLAQAEQLLAGRWLGPYDQFTLAKGPAYSGWIALSHLFGVPLLFGQHVAYLLAAALAVWALRPLMPNRWVCLAVFAWLAWNPATFSGADGTRVLRNGLAAIGALPVFALAVGTVLRWPGPRLRLAGWAGATGVAAGVFWLTREEGVWLLAGLVPVAGWAVVRGWREGAGDRWVQLGLGLALPVAGWAVVVGGVAAVNRMHYGWWGTVEFRAGEFAAAVGALQRVHPAEWRRHVPVAREVRERLYAVSPAMAELRDYFEGPMGDSWARPVGKADEVGGGERREIPGAAFVWALREAVAAAGYHRSAPEALAFYRRLAAEVNAAVDSGLVPGGPRRRGFLPPWRAEYTREFVPAWTRAAGTLLSLRGWVARPRASAGEPERLEWVGQLTRERLSPLEGAPLLPFDHPQERALRWLERVARGVYAPLLPWVVGFGWVAWAAGIWTLVRRRRWPGLMAWSALGAAGSCAALCGIVALIEITSFEATMLSYLAPAYPMALLFPVLAGLAWREAAAAGKALH